MTPRPAGWVARLRPDWYLILLMAMVGVATIAPAVGDTAVGFDWATRIAIGFVFFLHGARLPREAVIRGLTHWRLHLVVLAATYVLFPILCLGLAALPPWITPASMASGIIFLGCLPSTIQSSIAFTAVGRGNVAAAVAAASGSNILGIVLTPLLVALLLQEQGAMSLKSLEVIALQLLAPFVAGQVLRRWIGGWVAARGKTLSYLDRGAILLVVYTAFSGAVMAGVWDRVSVLDLIRLTALCCVLLAAVLGATLAASRALGFDRADEVAIIFCGSKKSLATGAPMAGVLFATAGAGLMLLPLMIFHQIQLMACAVIAEAYAKRRDSAGEVG